MATDYIHLQNLIMTATENIAMKGAKGDHDTATKEYAELIDFLEHMYVNAVLALAGTMIKTAETMEPEVAEGVLIGVREMLDTPPKNVFTLINRNYQELIKHFQLTDVYKRDDSS